MKKLHVLAAVLLLPHIAFSQGDSMRRSSADRVTVELVGVRTPAGSATSDTASGGPALQPGEEGTAYLLAGGFDPSGRPVDSLCVGSVGSPDPDENSLGKAVHAWRARFKVLSATMESIVLEVDWRRETAGSPGARIRAAGDRRMLTLHEGDRQTLDFLPAEPGDGRCGKSLRIDVRASIAEDKRFRDERIHYDLWLVDEAPDRPPLARELERTAAHGEVIDFAIPLRYSLDNVRFKDGLAAHVMAKVSGSIRGRVREDGTLDVLLDASRLLGIVEAGKDPTGSVGDGGRKSLRLAPGETLDLLLPPPQGAHTLGLDGQWSSTVGAPGMTTAGIPLPGPAGGVEVDAERVTVDFAKFLSGHRMSLRLTATRITQ